ncbi:MAG: hypothetical protein MPN21_05850 [Thermoanaerobaculia bacterium]|nr:hypothetical protein [Thermoanaerobaculia bacterium]
MHFYRSFLCFLFLTSLALIMGACRDGSAADRIPRPDFVLGGIQVNEAEHARWFENLKAQGMNSVQLTDYAMQGDWDTDHLWWDEDEPWVMKEMRGAGEQGLTTVFICRVALDHAFERNAFLWHGMIRPKTDEMLASWFEQYGRFVLRWARIAEEEGVGLFVIGSEMNALATTIPAVEPPPLEEYYLNAEKQEDRREQVLAQQELIAERHLTLPESEGYASVEEYIDARIAIEQGWARSVTGSGATGRISLQEVNAHRARLDSHWRELIGKVREVYSGPIGYAANFDQYHLVGFWDALDVMGVNAYFELRSEVLDEESPETLYPLLEAGWQDVLGRIATFREEQRITDQPVIFTEMGYTYRAKSTLRPWADEGFSLIYQPTTNPDGSEGEMREYVVVWRDQPQRFWERALAVRALREAHQRLDDPFLGGILYWKLSSHDYHYDDESFMVHVGPGSEDPVLGELRSFVE